MGGLRCEFPEVVPFERWSCEVDGGNCRISRSQQSHQREFRSSHFPVSHCEFLKCEVKKVVASVYCLNAHVNMDGPVFA